MQHLIDRIGPYLGIAAFLGLAVLTVLLFLEAREVRRLREWAGRAPERAAEAAEAGVAAAEAKGEGAPEERRSILSRIVAPFAAAGAGVRERLGPPVAAADRRSPVDLRILLGVIAAAVIAAGVLTSGFGLFSSGGGEPAKTMASPDQTKVAVLNGSQQEGVSGVPGLAGNVLRQVVKPAGYRAGKVTDAPASFPKTVVMYAPNNHKAAKSLATSIKPKLGETKTQKMSSEVAAVVGKTPLVVVLGADDANFGG
jgi:LytR cell envelope-related transcriptional attenuator